MDEVIEQPITEAAPVTENKGNEGSEDTDPNIPISKDTQSALRDILRVCENEDQGVYWALIQKWARLEYYFNNIISIFWDANYANGMGGWREPNWDELEGDGDINPRIIAIYRAHAEAIIAALSVTVPSVVFFPDNADDPADIETADTYSAISAMIQKHVKAPMILMRALTILFNQGTIFAYNYYKTDKRFGVIHKPVYETVPYTEYQNICPVCDVELGVTAEPINGLFTCPECGQDVAPIPNPIESNMQVQSGTEPINKGRILIDLFDPRSVKVSLYAREQGHLGYILLNFSQSVAMIRASFQDDKIQAVTNYDSMDWARNAVNYYGSAPENVANVKCLWLRPFQFYSLTGRMEVVQELLAAFPDGCYCIFINNELKYVTHEDMDEHWTISINPLSSYIHGEPLGTNLATVQDIQAEMDELRLQTVEQGIVETFVKPEVLDVDEYKQQRAAPGNYTATKGANPDKALSEGFFQTKAATLSSELEIFNQDLTNRAEFVTGSLPSIYGGTPADGGGTAYEYKKSNQNALQRLGIYWKIVSEFWCDLITKSTVEYESFMTDDENFVERSGGSFRNIQIRKAAMLGKVSRCEPEYSDQLPVTWEQMNQVVNQLLQLKDPEINSVLFDPNNAELMKKAVGLKDLWIPGEDSRTKQISEFVELSQSMPMGMMPSIMPDPTDNHGAELEVLQHIINSARGQRLKRENPVAFQNVLMHYQAHLSMMPKPELKPEGEGKPNAERTSNQQ